MAKRIKSKQGQPTRITIPDFDRSTIPAPVYDILKQLRMAGYESLLVGGCVRDYLLGAVPKDFDIVTDALPEAVRKAVSRSRIIGRRFRLVHVPRNREIYEVATYRKKSRTRPTTHNGSNDPIFENSYGNQEQDAFRRDFTVNALYLDPSKKQVIDYTGGLEDIKQKVLRSIGPANIRFQEDPVRVLRAIRLSSKLDLTLEKEVDQAVHTSKSSLLTVKPARLRDEFVKLFLNGWGEAGYDQILSYGIAEEVFPYLTEDIDLVRYAMRESDKRIRSSDRVSSGYLFAALLWPAYQRHCQSITQSKRAPSDRQQLQFEALSQVLRGSFLLKGLQKHIRDFVFEVFALQDRLLSRKTPKRTLNNPQIRPAIHLLALRSKVGEVDKSTVKWWKARQPARKTKSSRRRRTY